MHRSPVISILALICWSSTIDASFYKDDTLYSIRINDHPFEDEPLKVSQFIASGNAESDIDDDQNDENIEYTQLTMYAEGGQKFICRIPNAAPTISDANIKAQLAQLTVEDVEKALKKSFRSSKCIRKTFGYWTYDLCFRQSIKQYHLEKEDIKGVTLSLGDYAGSLEPSKAPIGVDKTRYFSQNYTDGTICDKGAKLARHSEVRYYCIDTLEETDAVITNYEEPQTCSYIIYVGTGALCAFQPYQSEHKRAQPRQVKCSPVLSQKELQEHYDAKITEIMNITTMTDTTEYTVKENHLEKFTRQLRVEKYAEAMRSYYRTSGMEAPMSIDTHRKYIFESQKLGPEALKRAEIISKARKRQHNDAVAIFRYHIFRLFGQSEDYYVETMPKQPIDQIMRQMDMQRRRQVTREHDILFEPFSESVLQVLRIGTGLLHMARDDYEMHNLDVENMDLAEKIEFDTPKATTGLETRRDYYLFQLEVNHEKFLSLLEKSRKIEQTDASSDDEEMNKPLEKLEPVYKSRYEAAKRSILRVYRVQRGKVTADALLLQDDRWRAGLVDGLDHPIEDKLPSALDTQINFNHASAAMNNQTSYLDAALAIANAEGKCVTVMDDFYEALYNATAAGMSGAWDDWAPYARNFNAKILTKSGFAPVKNVVDLMACIKLLMQTCRLVNQEAFIAAVDYALLSMDSDLRAIEAQAWHEYHLLHPEKYVFKGLQSINIEEANEKIRGLIHDELEQQWADLITENPSLEFVPVQEYPFISPVSGQLAFKGLPKWKQLKGKLSQALPYIPRNDIGLVENYCAFMSLHHQPERAMTWYGLAAEQIPPQGEEETDAQYLHRVGRHAQVHCIKYYAWQFDLEKIPEYSLPKCVKAIDKQVSEHLHEIALLSDSILLNAQESQLLLDVDAKLPPECPAIGNDEDLEAIQLIGKASMSVNSAILWLRDLVNRTELAKLAAEIPPPSGSVEAQTDELLKYRMFDKAKHLLNLPVDTGATYVQRSYNSVRITNLMIKTMRNTENYFSKIYKTDVVRLVNVGKVTVGAFRRMFHWLSGIFKRRYHHALYHMMKEWLNTKDEEYTFDTQNAFDNATKYLQDVELSTIRRNVKMLFDKVEKIILADEKMDISEPPIKKLITMSNKPLDSVDNEALDASDVKIIITDPNKELTPELRRTMESAAKKLTSQLAKGLTDISNHDQVVMLQVFGGDSILSMAHDRHQSDMAGYDFNTGSKRRRSEKEEDDDDGITLASTR